MHAVAEQSPPPQRLRGVLEKLFHMDKAGADARSEVLAGVTFRIRDIIVGGIPVALRAAITVIAAVFVFEFVCFGAAA